MSYNQYKQAIEYFNKCLDKNPFHYESLFNRGLVQEHILYYWDALESYERAVNICHSDYLVIYKFASLLKDLWYNERAIQKYNFLMENKTFISEEKEEIAKQIFSDLAIIYCRCNELNKAAYLFDISYIQQKREYLRDKDSFSLGILDFSFEKNSHIRVEFTLNSARIISIQAFNPTKEFSQKMCGLSKDHPNHIAPLIREDQPVSLPINMELFKHINSLQRV